MLHIDALVPNSDSATAAAIVRKKSGNKGTPSIQGRLIEMSFRSVEMDGCNLWREPDDVAVGQLAEALRLADLHGKSELKINNITPWIAVGHVDSCRVPTYQRKIQGYLELACEKLKRQVPECRLDLSRGEYGIRCYLGRVRPTDHVYDEDLVSDSR
ncbi:MAG: hypothetical protein V3V25_10390 [Paracoccaceae bacterium]